MAQQRRFSGGAVAAAATLPTLLGATGVLLAALPATPAQAQAAGAELRVLSPRPNAVLGSETFSLDVSFKSRSKSPVLSAELWVDGVRWVRRDLDSPQVKNVLSFAVDASTLSEGAHAVVVKVFCANGAVSSTQINVQAGTNSGVSEGATSGPQMKFIAPVNGKRVAGTVDITMDAPTKAGMNPYVTFYVDKQFKTLKNYPPYSYAWDTTGVANGYHTVEAMGYTDASNATTTRRVTVYVDNAGGATDIKSDIPDLSEARKQAPVTNAARAAAPVVLPVPKPAVKPAPFAPVGEAAFAAPAVADTDAVSSLGLSKISTAFRTDAKSLHAVLPGTRKASKTVTAAKVATTTTAQAAQWDVRSADFTPTLPVLSDLSTPAASVRSVAPVAPVLRLPVVQPTAPRNAPATAIAPRFAAAPPARFAPLLPAAAPRPLTKTAPRVTVKPAAMNQGMARLQSPRKNAKTLQVAFDGQQIAFDVQPRVEAGLPLAPFRQIFEHTGGQVMWVPETRVVRAVSADREIVIGVGKSRANVNGQSVSLQKPAFIEKGRTIVPLSFVGKALDVDVKYDPATGHLQITSK